MGVSYCLWVKKTHQTASGRCVDTAFQTRRMQSCCHFAPQKNCNKLMWAFYTLINLFRKLIWYFSFTIPHKVATVNLRNYSLLFRTVSITCMIPYQRATVSNLIFISVVLGRSWGKIAVLNPSPKPERW